MTQTQNPSERSRRRRRPAWIALAVVVVMIVIASALGVLEQRGLIGGDQKRELIELTRPAVEEAIEGLAEPEEEPAMELVKETP